MWPTTVPWLAPTSWWMSSGALTRRKASAKAGWRAESCLTRLVTNQAGVMSAPSWPRVMQKQAADHAARTRSRAAAASGSSAGAGPAPASQAASTDLPAPGSPVSRNSRSEPVSSHSATCRRAHTRPTSPARPLADDGGDAHTSGSVRRRTGLLARAAPPFAPAGRSLGS